MVVLTYECPAAAAIKGSHFVEPESLKPLDGIRTLRRPVAQEAAQHESGTAARGGRSRPFTRVSRYGEAGREHHGREPGSVMVVAFELDGKSMAAINGGPRFRFTEAISLVVNCETQEEADYYWNALGAGGVPRAQRCGWLKDRYGLSWQVVPTIVSELLAGDPTPASQRAMAAIMPMKKVDSAAVQAAYEDD